MPRTALIVDDSTTMREMVGFTLRSAGFEVVESRNGQEALTTLAAQPGGKIDLIITDLNMPVMDGLTFIREVRTNPAARSTPILMLTSESDESRKAAGKAAGATGWILKPFRPDQLLKVITRVLPG